MSLLKKKMFLGKIIYLLHCTLLLVISFFFDRFYQMLLFLLTFNFMQGCFKFRFHSDTIEKNPVKAVKYCKIITISIEIIYLFYCKNINIDIYSNLIIIIFICFINCLIEFYYEHTMTNNSFDEMLRDKDTLLDMCANANLSKESTNRMILKYVDCKTYDEIAEIESITPHSVAVSINRTRNKIKKLYI